MVSLRKSLEKRDWGDVKCNIRIGGKSSGDVDISEKVRWSSYFCVSFTGKEGKEWEKVSARGVKVIAESFFGFFFFSVGFLLWLLDICLGFVIL